jgi:hypothetical protein
MRALMVMSIAMGACGDNNHYGAVPPDFAEPSDLAGNPDLSNNPDLAHRCTPNCTNRQCGPNGCGGSCGACGGSCSTAGVCLTKACTFTGGGHGGGCQTDNDCQVGLKCLSRPVLLCGTADCGSSTNGTLPPGFTCEHPLICEKTCITNSDCTTLGGFPFCVSGVCQTCSANSDCGGGLICGDNSTRYACNTPSDCPGPANTYVCQ